MNSEDTSLVGVWFGIGTVVAVLAFTFSAMMTAGNDPYDDVPVFATFLTWVGVAGLITALVAFSGFINIILERLTEARDNTARDRTASGR